MNSDDTSVIEVEHGYAGGERDGELTVSPSPLDRRDCAKVTVRDPSDGSIISQTRLIFLAD